MSDYGKIIGRQREIALLHEIIESPKAEFVAVYGRWRIDKTYLIDKFFRDTYDFYMTGTKKTLHLTMITSYGLEHNAGWQTVQNEVVLDDLFKME